MLSHDPRSFLATSKSRTFAYLLDLCGCSFLLMPTAYATYCLGWPSAGALEFALLFLAYNAYFLSFKGGVTPGKYIQNIQVLGSRRRELNAWQALVRAACLATPWLLVAVDKSSALVASLPRDAAATLPTAGAAWIVIDAMLIEYTRDRRSLTDRIASTIVVALPPPQPHRAPAAPMFSASDAEFGFPPKKPPKD